MVEARTFASGYDFAMDYLEEHPHRLASQTARDAVRWTLTQLGESGSDVAMWLWERRSPVLFIALDDYAYTWNVRGDVRADSAVIVFGSVLLRRGLGPTAGVVAHELGHVWLRDHGATVRGQEEEQAADAKAADWGVGGQLLASLRADVEDPVNALKRSDLQARIDALLRHPKLRAGGA